MAGYDNNKLGELRPNQIITTFGPGSIVDAVKDSVTILDIPYWKDTYRYNPSHAGMYAQTSNADGFSTQVNHLIWRSISNTE